MKIIAILTGSLALAGGSFVGLSPELGGKPTDQDRARFALSGHYVDGEFRNLIPTEVMTGGSTLGVLWAFLFRKSDRAKPDGPLPTQPLDSLTIANNTQALTRVTWLGHSASLVELAGQNILLDPMLSTDMGPVSWATPNRYNDSLAIAPDKLPYIAAVLISHDHYDHLDYQTIKLLKDRVTGFYVPLGIGAHLREWGVDANRIHEMNWGDSVQLPNLLLRCTPSRHFSGRGLGNRNSTLWCSWVMQTTSKRLFYSGDGGYGPHFARIGQQFGPFDLALLECGQYNPQWAEIHMMPEQSVQAARDLRARVMLPVHWGAFTEANHAWDDPIRRATAEAARLGQPLTTPRLGQPVVLDAGPLPSEKWWEEVK